MRRSPGQRHTIKNDLYPVPSFSRNRFLRRGREALQTFFTPSHEAGISQSFVNFGRKPDLSPIIDQALGISARILALSPFAILKYLEESLTGVDVRFESWQCGRRR